MLQNDCHSADRVDVKNLNGSCSVWLKFALKSFVILENLLTNLVVKINVLFLAQSNASLTNRSLGA